jgi:23S rRNA pseudouridine2605 synthase
MCEAHNVRILQLTRVAIGKIKLDKLENGKWRYLNEKEIHYLKTV